MRKSVFVAAFTIALWTLGGPVPAGESTPVFSADFDTACVSADDWQVSGRLAPSARADRIHCVAAPAGGRALAVTVRPGDAYDPNPGSAPTERVELQLRREVVRFDATTWYSFRFRIAGAWPARRNRTVIQQIKQNIDPLYEKGRGQQEICDAANPLFKIEVDSDGATPVFRAKVAGAEGCGDSVGQQRICGDWPIGADAWHRVNVIIKPSQRAGGSHLQLWLDGRACPTFDGVLGYPRYGVRRDGLPVIDTQPRFGIYRDALPDLAQTILFDDIRFWDKAPVGVPDWLGLETVSQP